MVDLAQQAVDTALARGATYADARICRYRDQNLHTEDERVAGIGDSESFGVGVRVLARGSWGFAASATVTLEAVQSAAAEAVAIAQASSRVATKPVELVPEPPRQAEFIGSCDIDPFSVPVEEKVGLLLELNRMLLSHAGISKAHAHMTLRGFTRTFVSSEGSVLSSRLYTCGAGYMATAVDEHDSRSRSFEVPPMTRGYENIDAARLRANATRVAEQAVEHLKAPTIEDGRTTLVLDPHNLALTIHESVGHATELDRALGMEESLAGSSFATPDKLNSLQYGSPIVNFVAYNTLEHGLATWGFDDEGVECQTWHIVQDGIFRGYGASREVAGAIGLPRANGTCRADSWASIPIVRQPNLCLMPGAKPLSLDELISDTDEGIYIEGMGSFSIDQKRLNFQFGGDAFWRIRNGRLAGMLKNVTYQSITPEFWNSCDAICDERFWVKNGVLNCGKGDPGQVAQMTHAAAPARFRNVTVRPAK